VERQGVADLSRGRVVVVFFVRGEQIFDGAVVARQ
jgi:hypothetical protein